jgi:pyridoxine 5-phosphate synthase
LYTEAYAVGYTKGEQAAAVAPYVAAGTLAKELGLGINAGHDLSLENMAYFKQSLAHLDEVSIGHALICESLYLGLENVIPMYLKALS